MSWDDSERDQGEGREEAPAEPEVDGSDEQQPAEPEAEGSGEQQPAAPEVEQQPDPEVAAQAAAGEEPAAQPETAEQAEQPEEQEQPEAAAEPEQPEAAAEPEQPEAAAEPEQAEQPDPEPARRDRGAGQQADRGEQKRDVVPGADLDPIAITEERELTAEERARLEAEEEERRRREAAATAEDDDEQPAPQRSVAVPGDALIQATGKRKSSVARVLVRSGSGKIEINRRTIEEYFPRPHHQSLARQPLIASGYDGSVDVRIRVHGGGVSGQAGAVRHGIARALVELDGDLRGELKRRGLLTRDAREKERRKAGLKKARKRPQFSKR